MRSRSIIHAGDRSVVANMAPEYGATTGYFPIDSNTLEYLKSTGRGEAALALVEGYAKRQGLWFDGAAEPRYTQCITIDLSAIEMHIAGPKRPQDLLPYAKSGAALAALNFQPTTRSDTLPKHPVAIAAITSCTNTSDPALLIAAGLLARKARQLGVKVPHWVKTSLGPGSPAAASYLKRAGLLDALEAVGFGIVGYGCTNFLPLRRWPRTAGQRQASGRRPPTSARRSWSARWRVGPFGSSRFLRRSISSTSHSRWCRRSLPES